jgi:glycosyltransferase involved in cell wall biosynthesis
MTNAAIYLHPNGFDTSGARLLGRHSAGESFLRGFLQHGDVEAFVLWNVMGRPQPELDALLARIGTPSRPVRWLPARGRGALADPGVLNLPGPNLPEEAWRRRAHGDRRYSICGITHTTATERVMAMIANFLVAPLDAHDALICTSSAVRGAVEAQLDLMRDYMGGEYGARRRPEPLRATIPLGVNTAEFAATDADRRAWRERLEIPDDAVVALFVGRFHVKAKMNPALMAMALERAAARCKRPICWVNAGWAETAEEGAAYHAGARALCPSVLYREVDGRPVDVRRSIWSVGDFFISFSDNIQETFGLTPIEAMAAGLPCVVTDWDGYKDTVRHGLDGFRIPTVAPEPGLGRDFAYTYANKWLAYSDYVGGTSQLVAADLREAEAAIAALVEDADLRRRMGESARRQAISTFDWAAIIPQYQALWGEQNKRRLAEPATPPAIDPVAPDPFTLFANYPSRHMRGDDIVSLTPGMSAQAAQARMAGPLAAASPVNRMTPDEVVQVVGQLIAAGPQTVNGLAQAFPPARRSFVYRSVLWLAKHDVVQLDPAG